MKCGCGSNVVVRKSGRTYIAVCPKCALQASGLSVDDALDKFDDFASLMYVRKRERSSSIKRLACEVKEVIFNPPATIVYFSDGSKTVVKCTICNNGLNCDTIKEAGLCPALDNAASHRMWKHDGLMYALLKAKYGNDYLKVLDEWAG